MQKAGCRGRDFVSEMNSFKGNKYLRISLDCAIYSAQLNGARLNVKEITVLREYFEEGYSLEKIAKRRGVTVESVRQSKIKGIVKIRQALVKERISESLSASDLLEKQGGKWGMRHDSDRTGDKDLREVQQKR